MNIINNSKFQPQNMTIEELFHIILFELGFSFSLLGTQYLEELFGYTVDPERGKPTLLEFLCLMMKLLKL